MGAALTDLGMQATLAGWPTPTAKEKAGGEYKDTEKAIARAMGPHSNDLRDFVRMAGWPTPTTTMDHKDGASAGTLPPNALLGRVVWLTAETGKPGRLNPEFCRWLMGYPDGWSLSMDTETP